MTQQPNYQPGDVANGHRLGEDGQWHPIDPTTATPAPATAGATPKGGVMGWVGRHKILTAVGALFLLIVVFTSLSGGGGSDTTTVAATGSSATPTVGTSTEKASETSTPTASPTPTMTPTPTPAKTTPAMTRAQENALRAAQDYLKFQAFSKKGLIDQLSSDYGEGFDKADATWAVDHLDVNWNEQAVRAAEQYLKFQAFSRQGLIDQLSSEYGEQFTVKQATYAADKVGL